MVFAWSYEDMPGLDIDIVVHRLQTKEGFLPMKQKVHRMRPEMKQFNAVLLAVTSYPQWVANMVSVPKKDGKVRVRVDYRDMNKASRKMISRFHILMSWLITPLNTKFSLLWMVILVTTKSRLPPKTWKRLLSLHSGALSISRSCHLG